MARSHAVTTCVQSDSIKGMAQSIAKPAYHRLLIAESTLRRAVPALIIAFLVTICSGAFVQVLDQTRHDHEPEPASSRGLAMLPCCGPFRSDRRPDLIDGDERGPQA